MSLLESNENRNKTVFNCFDTIPPDPTHVFVHRYGYDYVTFSGIIILLFLFILNM